MWYKNIAGRFFGLVTKHVCDRQTDGQNYNSQDRAGIAASHGNKVSNVKLCCHAELFVMSAPEINQSASAGVGCSAPAETCVT